MKKNIYQLEQSGKIATISIYGEIGGADGINAGELVQKIEAMHDVSEITVYINSYGGEVKEGIAIYNALKRHPAKIRTVCDGFACSIASVIFMAGDVRVMNEASMLMIHNAWSCVAGNSAELRKQADDLEKITQLSIEAYRAGTSMAVEDIKAMMDAETWILPDEALEKGFATEIEISAGTAAQQNAWKQLFNIVKHWQEEQTEDETEETTDDEAPEEQPETAPEDGEQGEPETEQPEEEPEQETEEQPETEQPESEPEEPEEEPEEIPGEGETEEEQPEAVQKWSGFFNALLK